MPCLVFYRPGFECPEHLQFAGHCWHKLSVAFAGLVSLGRIMNAVDSAIDPFLGSAVFGGLSRFGACVVQKLETGVFMSSQLTAFSLSCWQLETHI